MKVTCAAEEMTMKFKSKLFGLTTDEASKVTPEPDTDSSNPDGFDFVKQCRLGECGMTYKIVGTK